MVFLYVMSSLNFLLLLWVMVLVALSKQTPPPTKLEVELEQVQYEFNKVFNEATKLMNQKGGAPPKHLKQ